MKTIVALVDFSDVTPPVLDHATKFARAFQARLVLLHAVPDHPAVVELGLASPTVMVEPSEKKIEADYNSLLDLRDSLAQSGVQVLVQQLEHSSVAKLLDQCLALDADLIVMGSHHHGAFYQLLVGTLTSDVLKRATCPVLVVPAPSGKPA
jgi:nucleotide-binding universal stress UspA family protein